MDSEAPKQFPERRLSGREQGVQNVAKLKAYLEANRGRLPQFGGKLNKARIAREAGVDRQIFTDNPAAIELLSAYGDASVDLRAHVVASDAQVMEKIQRLEAQVAKYRDLAARREVELAKRRREGAENETRLRIFETMMETMRNVPTPPRKTDDPCTGPESHP